MKIAVIGAGFTGLTIAHRLIQKGFDVFVFEKEDYPGGLASGFKEKNWNWFLDKHYHHIFTSDSNIKNIAKEFGIKFNFFRPKTKSLIGEKIYSLDSPIDVIKFQQLSIFERLRMGLILGLLKINFFWKPMESVTAKNYLPKLMGENAYKKLWEPLFSSKFGIYKDDVPLSWFWARIKKRSSRLGYPEGGFQYLSNKIIKTINEKGVMFYFGNKINEIEKEKEKIRTSFTDLKTNEKRSLLFDKVIVTTPLPVFTQITKGLPIDFIEKFKNLKNLASLSLILILKEPFLKDKTYWLNICNKDFPFLCAVEHTNFIDKSHYGNTHIVYIGKYLPSDHPYLKKTPEELLKIYHPYLKKINNNYETNLIKYKVFTDFFTQLVVPLNY